MIPHAFNYQEMLSVDAFTHYYYIADLQLNVTDCVAFVLCFIVTPHAGDIENTGSWCMLQNGISMRHIILSDSKPPQVSPCF